jgi:hypothetical protein
MADVPSTIGRIVVRLHLSTARRFGVTATVLAAAAATAVVAAPAANAQDVPSNCLGIARDFGTATAFIDNTTREWVNFSNTRSSTETPSALSPEVAPAITGLFGQQYEQAFKASDGTLWVDNAQTGGNQVRTNGVAHTLGSHSGPAISSYVLKPGDPAGHAVNRWRVTWVENGQLLALDQDSQNTVTVLATDAGPSTTPGIAAADNGRTAGFFESYVNTHGNITVIRPDGSRITETAFRVRPGTGVPIAVNTANHWLMEAQASDMTMWEFSDSRGAEPTVFTTNATPSVTALSDDTFQRAFISNTNGDLFVGFDDTGLHAANNTSPSIAGSYVGAHWTAAFQSAAHHLQTVTDTGAVGDAGNAATVTLGATSSPAIADQPFCGIL